MRMLERIARAISPIAWKWRDEQRAGSAVEHAMMHRSLDAARAAVEAMKGGVALPYWNAIIDAILNEKDE